MIRKSLILLFLSAFLASTASGQEAFRSVVIDTDTIASTWIKEKINNDSVRILEYKKIRYPDMPEMVDERLVYFDLQKSVITKEVTTSCNQIVDIFNGGSYLTIQRNREDEGVENPYDEISGTYVQIHKLNDEYILFLPDFDHPSVVSDSAYMYKDDEGLLYFYFDDIIKENDVYKIRYKDFHDNICQKTIHLYDEDKRVFLWEETYIGANNREFTNYKLYIPVSEAVNYPALNIFNTAGLDDIYDNFDKPDLVR